MNRSLVAAQVFLVGKGLPAEAERALKSFLVVLLVPPEFIPITQDLVALRALQVVVVGHQRRKCGNIGLKSTSLVKKIFK